MLQSVTIENIAVIKKAQLELSEGANFIALTGETGAGKSIMIDAISAVLGERTNRDLLRTGAESARVTALFQTQSPTVQATLQRLDLPEEPDGTLVLSRSLSASGKNTCRVNGTPVTVSVLRQVGQVLLNIHGQHDNQALLDSKRHIEFIDAVAEHTELLQRYRTAYRALRALKKEYDALQIDEEELLRTQELLQHQCTELSQAKLRLGEWEELRARQEVLQNHAMIHGALQEALGALEGAEERPGAVFQAFLSSESMKTAGLFLQEAQALSETTRAAAYELEECVASVRDLLEGVQVDPEEADAAAERLDLYYRFSLKYGATTAEMLLFLDAAQERLQTLEQNGEHLAVLENDIEAQQLETIRCAKQLSHSRALAAETFTQNVQAALAELDMPQVRLQVLTQKVPLGLMGGEQMEFLISANPGEAPKPLAKIASGGELSRMMLALKSVLAEQDEIETLIFDEIDTGVSGRAAQKIGLKLREVAQRRQVLCVTHLAQISAHADLHLFIRKSIEETETQTEIVPLDFVGRTQELARIMGGEPITTAQLAAAEELLLSAQGRRDTGSELGSEPLKE